MQNDHLEVRISFAGFRFLLLVLCLNIFVFGYGVVNPHSKVFFLKPLSQEHFLKGDFSPILTSLFLHDGFAHLFGNLVVLIYVGIIVSKLLGEWLFLAVYLGTGVIANLLFICFHAGTVGGASGAIFGLIGAFLGNLAAQDRDLKKSLKTHFTVILITMADFIYSQWETLSFVHVATSVHIFGFVTGIGLGFYSRSVCKKNKPVGYTGLFET
jgi:membrane associated rhomboid family serine protease